jgi:transcriptional regulator with XRE-family HTH domain
MCVMSFGLIVIVVQMFAPCQLESVDICVIYLRLKQERERMGLTQPAFADLAGAAKRTVIDWEKGVSSPTAVQMAAFAKAGLDVDYVITGKTAKDRAAEIYEGLPRAFAALRGGKTEAEMGAKIGVTAERWAEIERGGRGPTSAELMALGDAFPQTDFIELVTGSPRVLSPPATGLEVVLVENYRACLPPDQDAIRYQVAALAARATVPASSMLPDGRYPQRVDAPPATLHDKPRKKGM